MTTYLALLRRRPHFRALWVAELISLFGDWFNAIATVMVVNRFGNSGVAVSALFLARALPPFLIGPVAGVVADRFNRKAVLIISDVLRAAIVLGFLFVDRPERLWLMYVLSFAQFTVSAFFEPARAAILPDVVENDELITANTLSSVSWSVMLALGAAVGGVVAASFGSSVALLIDASSFLLSAALLAPIVLRPRTGPVPAPTSGWRDFVEGWAYVRERPALARVALIKGLGQVGSVDVMAAVLAARVFPLGQDGGGALGLMLAMFGLGTVLGPVVGNYFHDQSLGKLQRLVTVGFGFMVVGWWVVGLGATGFSAWALPVVALGLLVRGMGGSANWTYSDILIQLSVPKPLLGRVFSLNLAFFTLMLSLSVWASGYALDQFHMLPAHLALAMGTASLVPWAVWWWAGRRGPALTAVVETT